MNFIAFRTQTGGGRCRLHVFGELSNELIIAGACESRDAHKEAGDIVQKIYRYPERPRVPILDVEKVISEDGKTFVQVEVPTDDLDDYTLADDYTVAGYRRIKRSIQCPFDGCGQEFNVTGLETADTRETQGSVELDNVHFACGHFFDTGEDANTVIFRGFYHELREGHVRPDRGERFAEEAPESAIGISGAEAGKQFKRKIVLQEIAKKKVDREQERELHRIELDVIDRDIMKLEAQRSHIAKLLLADNRQIEGFQLILDQKGEPDVSD